MNIKQRPMPNILLICSNIHKDLAAEQLDLCSSLVKKADYDYQVELLEAGTYEIPFVINAYHQKNSFDAYLALGLVLQADSNHYNDIMTHIRYCFTQFALNNIIVGNGIISAPHMDILKERVENGERVEEAINAVDYLIRFKNKYKTTAYA